MPPENVHLTQATYDRLKQEHEHLTTVWRIDIAKRIEAARELGDLKENGDYHAAKNEQGLNEARVRQIEAILKHAVVVEATAGDKVETGTIVEVRMEGDDEPSTYLVGSIEERGTGYDVLSPGSPLGKALLGHTPGEVVTFDAPGGRFEVEILAVRPTD
jgi:transcription elongation factor GreA